MKPGWPYIEMVEAGCSVHRGSSSYYYVYFGVCLKFSTNKNI